MIHHLSIPAADPGRVAKVFAELFGGTAIAFPPVPGAFMAIAGDAHGTAIEVYPADTALRRDGACARTGNVAGEGAVHFALSVECDLARIEALAARDGWDCRVCSRGGDFDVIELWIENRLMVELLPPDFAARYLAFAGRFKGHNGAALMAGHRERVPA